MIRWYFEKFMQRVGYRKVWYFPSRHMPMGDFYLWKYRPDLAPGTYCGDEPYPDEIGLWTMHSEDWNRLSEWLNGFRTETQWKLDQILMEYYKTNPEIRGFEDNEYNTE